MGNLGLACIEPSLGLALLLALLTRRLLAPFARYGMLLEFCLPLLGHLRRALHGELPHSSCRCLDGDAVPLGEQPRELVHHRLGNKLLLLQAELHLLELAQPNRHVHRRHHLGLLLLQRLLLHAAQR